MKDDDLRLKAPPHDLRLPRRENTAAEKPQRKRPPSPPDPGWPSVTGQRTPSGSQREAMNGTEPPHEEGPSKPKQGTSPIRAER